MFACDDCGRLVGLLGMYKHAGPGARVVDYGALMRIARRYATDSQTGDMLCGGCATARREGKA